MTKATQDIKNATLSVSSIVEEIDEIEKKRINRELTPVDAGDKRLTLISQGLVALGYAHGVEIEKSHCDSRGEFSFNIKQNTGAGYGEKLATLLCRVHTRTGINAKKGFVMPQHNWLRINHFDAEKLLKLYVSSLANH